MEVVTTSDMSYWFAHLTWQVRNAAVDGAKRLTGGTDGKLGIAIEVACNGMFGVGKGMMIAPPDPDKTFNLETAAFARTCLRHCCAAGRQISHPLSKQPSAYLDAVY